MSLIKVASADKRIIDHLSEMSSLDDPRGDSFVNDLVAQSLQVPAIQNAASAHYLTHSDLAYVYKRVVEELYPDIFIMHGFRPIITVSMPFLDAQNFGMFAAFLCSDSTVHDESSLRRDLLAEKAIVFCRQLWVQAAATGKARDREWAFQRTKGYASMQQGKGCLSVVAISVLTVASVVLAAYST